MATAPFESDVAAHTSDEVEQGEAGRRTNRPTLLARYSVVVALLIGVVSGGLALWSSTRNATTFDEIVLIAGGARGYHTGVFDLAPDHPPLMQYVYGLPVWLSGVKYPDESAVSEATRAATGYRYAYSQRFFWQSGNDARRIAFLGRIPAALITVGLVLLAFLYVRSMAGDSAALVAAGLVAVLPDVLAHGGVAYNDLPAAAAFLGGIWAVDRAVRTPNWRSGAVAGLAIGIGFAVKASAIAILPVALLCIGAEARTRWREVAWWRALGLAVIGAAFVTYLVMVAVYRGDWDLSALQWAFEYRLRHYTGGHGANAFLLGEKSTTGWWYFFPVAFLFKTSAALHLLLLIAAVHGIRTVARNGWSVLSSPVRAPLFGLLVFLAFLLTSHLNIGFRYALPALPLVALLCAVGVTTYWRSAARTVRAVVALSVAWLTIFPLTYLPNPLSFVSEYGPPREQNADVFVDSSLDWGQGLLQLSEWLEERGNPRILLSYFGSALPEGYGIDYASLPSFFPLPYHPLEEGRAPEYLVISATNLQGAYLADDPFAQLRDVEPVAVIANTMYVFPWAREGD